MVGCQPNPGRRPWEGAGRGYRGALGGSQGGEWVLVGHVDVAGVRYELPDGRVLLDDVSFRVGEGAKVALVGANGAGKTTLLRIITGELVPHAGVVTRSGGLGVMRQIVGQGAGPTVRGATVADHGRRPAARRWPRRGSASAAARAWTPCERALMDTDDEATQMRYAAGAGGVRRRRRLRHRGDLGRLHGRGAGRALRPGEVPRAARPCPAASRSGWCWSTSCAAPTRCCCSTSPTTTSTCPGKIWLEERIRESDKTILFISHDRELLANTATRIVTVELRRARRQPGVDPPRRVRVVPRGAPGPVRPLRGAAPALGRGARQAQGPGADVQAEGGLQRRHGLPLPGGPDPAAQVRGGRSADRAAARAAGDDAAHGRPHRQARGGLRATSS